MKKTKVSNLSINKTKIASVKGGITDPCPGSDPNDTPYCHATDATEFHTCKRGCGKTNSPDCRSVIDRDCAHS